ncbi:MAG: SpoIID/LytB domain-containing protein [Acidobacteria bacterium]|nr:SpoIID/LytB domain-containing protein [Acidobacteriota bacterium]
MAGTKPAGPPQVRIGVFGLFHPQQLLVKALPGKAVLLQAEKQSFVLESSSGRQTAEIKLSPGGVLVRVGDRMVSAMEVRVSGRDGATTDFELAVPGKIHRRYRGILRITGAAGSLTPVVAMDLETGVSSAVQAETIPDTPLEALKAQAVATRSYFLAAKERHQDFDFCDTTHCQFLREPPTAGSLAWRATTATRGLVLTYRDQGIAAMFTRSCGGQTRTPDELGMPSANYPYFPVSCDFCQKHPMRWQRSVSLPEAERLAHAGEAVRLEIGRRQGWNAVPSNNFTVRREKGQAVLEGTGEGHGIGLCQWGAKAMAEQGADFRQILNHYYPNTQIQSVR